MSRLSERVIARALLGAEGGLDEECGWRRSEIESGERFLSACVGFVFDVISWLLPSGLMLSLTP